MAKQTKQLFDDDSDSPQAEIVPLSELVEGQEADFFALLSEKQLLTTRDNKPYFRVTFRDARREVSFPVWSDAPLATVCREQWQPGQFFKLRATYRETSYGPQLDIARIRLAEDTDAADGFDPMMCLPRSRFDAEEMIEEVIAIAKEHILDATLRDVVVELYESNRAELLALPAAKFNHHAYVSGYLEHVRNVVRNTLFLSQAYRDLYAELDPPLNVGVAIAGALLHDIGKLRELAATPAGADYTPSGTLIGHILQGRDMFLEAAAKTDMDAEIRLRVEHVIVSHQRLPEWGAPKPPMTPEALIVHHADDLDAKLQMMVAALASNEAEGEFTSKRNPLRMAIYRGAIPGAPD
jgi:3'-5' exoribonuclease